MKSKRIIVVGIGGIGSWLSDGLARMLEFQAPMSAMLVVDGDNFEPKNASRQNFEAMGNKAESFRDMMSPRVPNTFIIAKPAWIVSEEVAAQGDADEDEADDVIAKITAESLLQENDWVFVTVDNYAARKLLFEAAAKLDNIDVFTGGNGDVQNGDPLFATAYHYQRRNGADVTLSPLVMHDEYANPQDRNPGEMSCAERAAQPGGTQLIAVNMHVASLLLGMVSIRMWASDEEKAEAVKIADVYSDMSVFKMAAYDRRPADAIEAEAVPVEAQAMATV